MPEVSHLILAIGKSGPPKEISDLKERFPKLTIALFTTPYALPLLPSDAAIIVGYDEDIFAQDSVAEVLMGQLSPEGKLPVSYSNSGEIVISVPAVTK
jgi:hypothetical protein